MSLCITDRFISEKNYFILGSRGLTHNVTTDGTCSKFCGTTSVRNAQHGLLTIDEEVAKDVAVCLSTCDVVLVYDVSVRIAGNITWSSHSLTIKSSANITVASRVVLRNVGTGVLRLIAGFDGNYHLATVEFEDNAKIYNYNGSVTSIYYNPAQVYDLHYQTTAGDL